MTMRKYTRIILSVARAEFGGGSEMILLRESVTYERRESRVVDLIDAARDPEKPFFLFNNEAAESFYDDFDDDWLYCFDDRVTEPVGSIYDDFNDDRFEDDWLISQDDRLDDCY